VYSPVYLILLQLFRHRLHTDHSLDRSQVIDIFILVQREHIIGLENRFYIDGLDVDRLDIRTIDLDLRDLGDVSVDRKRESSLEDIYSYKDPSIEHE